MDFELNNKSETVVESISCSLLKEERTLDPAHPVTSVMNWKSTSSVTANILLATSKVLPSYTPNLTKNDKDGTVRQVYKMDSQKTLVEFSIHLFSIS